VLWDEPNVDIRLQTLRRSLPVKVLSHIDSRAVAMEAGIG